MADGAVKPRGRRIELDPEREIEAFKVLKEAYAREVEADPDFAVDLAEGETNLLETLDAMAEADALDEGLIAGVKAAVETLRFRAERFEKRRVARRAIIEQALLILSAKKLERPCATFSLTKHPPQLVITDEAAIPARFWISGDPKLDRKELKAALDAAAAVEEGAEPPEPIPGAELSNGSVSLTIRRR
jgi:Siphovirus Gp157